MTNMKLPLLIALGVLTTVGQGGQTASPAEIKSVVTALESLEPNGIWDKEHVLKADFDDDGVEDYALWGVMNREVVVSVIKGPLAEPPRHWLMRFAVDKARKEKGALCSAKVKINLTAPSLDVVQGKDIQVPPNTRGIKLDDGCDPYYIDWTQQRQRFEAYRLHLYL
jgi:hypothetical protein